MEEIQTQESEGSDFLKFDKRVLLLSIKRKIIFILVVAFIATVVAGLYGKITIKPKWKSQCKLIRHSKNVSSKSDVPYLYQQLDFNTVLQSFKMRKNMEEVIDSLKLNTTPAKLSGSISVKKEGRSNLIKISATHKDRQTSAKIANKTAEIFMKNYIEILNSAVLKIYDYYLSQKGIYSNNLDEIKQQSEEFREKHKILSIEKETQNKYDNLKQMELELMSTEMNVTALGTKISDITERLKDMPDQVPLRTTVTTSNQKTLKMMRNQLSTLKEKYTDQNPKVIKLGNEIKTFEQELKKRGEEELIPDQITYGGSPLKESLTLEKAQYENELNSSVKKITEYKNKIAGIKQTLQYLSPLEREFFDIKNNESTTKDHLQKIENRLIEAKTAMDSNLSDFEIIETAVPPKYAEGTGIKVIAIGAGFLAFFGSLLFFAAREFLDFSIKSDFDIKQVLKIKMLGEIPNKDNVSESTFYSQFQIFLGQLNSMLPERKPVILGFGKDVPETGTSFIIEELIELLLSQNKKIIWIESIDESNEEIEKYIINDPLYQRKKSENVNVISDNLHKVYFLANENIFKKILEKEQLQTFFENFKSYDLIIWELFYVHYNLQLFSTIADATDLLTFVARFRHSNKTQLVNALEFLKENCKTPVAGVLNDIKKPYFKSK